MLILRCGDYFELNLIVVWIVFYFTRSTILASILQFDINQLSGLQNVKLIDDKMVGVTNRES